MSVYVAFIYVYLYNLYSVCLYRIYIISALNHKCTSYFMLLPHGPASGIEWWLIDIGTPLGESVGAFQGGLTWEEERLILGVVGIIQAEGWPNKRELKKVSRMPLRIPSLFPGPLRYEQTASCCSCHSLQSSTMMDYTINPWAKINAPLSSSPWVCSHSNEMSHSSTLHWQLHFSTEWLFKPNEHQHVRAESNVCWFSRCVN